MGYMGNVNESSISPTKAFLGGVFAIGAGIAIGYYLKVRRN